MIFYKHEFLFIINVNYTRSHCHNKFMYCFKKFKIQIKLKKNQKIFLLNQISNSSKVIGLEHTMNFMFSSLKRFDSIVS